MKRLVNHKISTIVKCTACPRQDPLEVDVEIEAGTPDQKIIEGAVMFGNVILQEAGWTIVGGEFFCPAHKIDKTVH